MATLEAATTRHRHTESLSGILTTNTYLGRKNHREGGEDRKICKAMAGKLNMTLQVTASPLWMPGATPSLATEKLLTSIVSIVTLPKFHLAMLFHKFFIDYVESKDIALHWAWGFVGFENISLKNCLF